MVQNKKSRWAFSVLGPIALSLLISLLTIAVAWGRVSYSTITNNENISSHEKRIQQIEINNAITNEKLNNIMGLLEKVDKKLEKYIDKDHK